MSTTKKGLIWASAIFGILAIILYFTSNRQLDSASAALLGTDSVINIQGTVFCAACAVICAVFAAAAILYDFIEKANHIEPPPKEPVLFCYNCGLRKKEDDLTTVKLKTRKGIVEKGICKKCLVLEDVKKKIVE